MIAHHKLQYQNIVKTTKKKIIKFSSFLAVFVQFQYDAVLSNLTLKIACNQNNAKI